MNGGVRRDTTDAFMDIVLPDPPIHVQRKRGCYRGCFWLFAIPVGSLFLIFWLVYPGVHYLGWLPSGQNYQRTRFEFRFGTAHRVVDDPGNHMQWVYGGMPDSISVENGTRVIVYNEPKAINKSWNDSMEGQTDAFHHKGYMGVWSDETHYEIDKNGVVQLPR